MWPLFFYVWKVEGPLCYYLTWPSNGLIEMKGRTEGGCCKRAVYILTTL
jgi:hypothetical protein